MRTPKTRETAPITTQDIAVIKFYLKREIERRIDRLEGQSLVCTFAIDWRNENKTQVERVTRFDLAYVDGTFVEGEAVPSEYRADRALISQMFEVAAANSLLLQKIALDKLPVTIPGYISCASNYAVLWEGCGMLYFTMMSDTSEADELNISVADNVRDTIFDTEEFADCRWNDDEWMKGFDWEKAYGCIEPC